LGTLGTFEVEEEGEESLSGVVGDLNMGRTGMLTRGVFRRKARALTTKKVGLSEGG
jgi:hypothetical protein